MRPARQLFDRLALELFGAGGRLRRAPHPLFASLYERVRAALDEAELCLHADLTSRANSVDIFFNFETWGQFVASRRAQVEQALETEIEAYRREAGYREEERVVLRLFVADPAQLEVAPDRPVVIARRVPDPLALDERWQSSLKHTTVVGGRARAVRALEGTPQVTQRGRPGDTEKDPAPSFAELAEVRSIAGDAPLGPSISGPALPTVATPLAVLRFEERGVERVAALEAAGIFGRGSGCDVRVELDPLEVSAAAELVSRRALAFRANDSSGLLEVENLGRWPLELSGGETLEPGATRAIERSATLTWPADEGGGQRFQLAIEAPRRGTLVLESARGKQRVVLRAPRTSVRADRSIFGELDVAFNVDFVDGTRFLILNNEGTVPLRLGALEGKQLQWPIDAPRALEAGPISIAIELEVTP